MKKIVGVVGSGMVGRDPFDPKCWSRSGYNLFTTLKTKGFLARAFGVEAWRPLRALLMVKNFHPRRHLWAQRLNLDPAYYAALTHQIRRQLIADDFEKENVTMQIGGHYNAYLASNGKIPAYSYHDGNIAGMMKSPFFPRQALSHVRRAFIYEKSVYRDMTKIFVMSEYWRQNFIEEFDVEPRRVINIGVGVNMEIPAAGRKDYSKKHIVFVGIDFRRKGGENLLAAFRKLRSSRHPDATLDVIGPREIPRALAGSGVDGIEFHGHLSREIPEQKKKLFEIFHRGTLFVLPSRYEPFGIAALEAMIFRMPVIATDDWSFPDFVVPETGTLLKIPDDTAEMADKMDAYLSDPDFAERSGTAGRELVIERYTWDRVVENIKREIST